MWLVCLVLGGFPFQVLKFWALTKEKNSNYKTMIDTYDGLYIWCGDK